MQPTSVDRTSHATVREWVVVTLFALGTQVLLTPRAYATKGDPELSDRNITSVVEAELRSDKGVSPNGVDVSTTEGVVTLSGTVQNLLAKRRTGTIVESIRGVRGVIDRTSVTPVSRSDQDIRKAILESLLRDPATASYQISVTVSNSVATLSGRAGSNESRTLAEFIAESVKGLKDVHDNISVQYLAPHADPQIAADVRARLAWDIWLNGDTLKTSVKDGRVALSGAIGSAIGKARAFDDAWVNGVVAVDETALKVEPRLRNDPHHQFTYVVKSDADIAQALQTAFRLDPRVAPFAPEATVEGGGVILSGSVDTLKAKTAAEQDAHDTTGVWRVDNFLKVRPKGPFVDGDVEKQLKTALAWDPLLDSSTIDVAVINRVAYLSGAVDSSLEEAEVKDIASRIRGIIAIRDHLKVEPDEVFTNDDVPYLSFYEWPYYDRFSHYKSVVITPQRYDSDAQMKSEIERSLSWSPFVNPDHIAVTVHGGVATLTGTVGSWIGWREADKDARKSAGDVIDRVITKKGSWWW